MSRIGKDAAGQFILDHCRKENIDIQSLKQDVSIDTSINVGLVTEDGERTFVTNRNGSLWKLNIDDVDFARFSGEIIITGQYFQQSSIGWSSANRNFYAS